MCEGVRCSREEGGGSELVLQESSLFDGIKNECVCVCSCVGCVKLRAKLFAGNESCRKCLWLSLKCWNNNLKYIFMFHFPIISTSNLLFIFYKFKKVNNARKTVIDKHSDSSV